MTADGPSHRLLWQCSNGGGMTTDSSFGGLLKQLRVQACLSQQQLADQLGTTQSAIARLEAGSARPSFVTLEKLAEALGEDLLVRVSGRESA
ncbi:XRE family transcriptional regulator [Kribbella antibiotica]|uniref:XRE family transcriptional regulator n=2 Tax=Kribbella antibiotica TaxID=190195 RepID=A0A4R4ZSK8_9ACTN|nr:XRE family transcriptional regulator [Kribbella antibiotica]